MKTVNYTRFFSLQLFCFGKGNKGPVHDKRPALEPYNHNQ